MQLQRPLRTRVATAGLCAAVLIGAVGSGSAHADPIPDHVLQNVSVSLGGDGTVTDISGTLVTSAQGQPADAKGSTTHYEPSKTAGDLPARVEVSYKTQDKAGTNLADLKGYTGRVEIDLTVQNLTVKPTNVTYDVAGHSVTRPALVGAPLTVVASTRLPGSSVASIVSPDIEQQKDLDSTNGVVSQTSDGVPQVQWASLLAPPTLSPNATLRLVTDAKNFAVPSFNISIQPGMVTDPSMSGLVTNSLSTGPDSELALQNRTIDLVAQVNDTLAHASDTISAVRQSLDTSAQTVGDKTVEDLKSSTQGVSQSMGSLKQELASLNDSISQQMSATQSSMLSQLQQTVAAAEAMLGDTSSSATTTQVTGEGCQTTVASPAQVSSVYGAIDAMAGQLESYATANEKCKAVAQQAILTTLGPAQPTDDTCKTPSATCAVESAHRGMDGVITQMVKDGADAVNALNPKLAGTAVADMKDITSVIATLQQQTDALDPAVNYEGVQLAAIGVNLAKLNLTLSALGDKTTAVHNAAQDGLTAENAMTSSDQKLADVLCTLQQHPAPTPSATPMPSAPPTGSLPTPSATPTPVASPTSGETLSAAKIDELRSYLSSVSCPDPVTGLTHPLVPPTGVTPALDAHAAQKARWQAILDATSDNGGKPLPGTLPFLLADAQSSSNGSGQALANLTTSTDSGYLAQLAKIKAVRDTVKTLSGDASSLSTTLDAVNQQEQNLGAQVTKSYDDAAKKARAGLSALLDPEVRQIAAQGQADSAAIGAMFDQTVRGMRTSATTMRANGKQTVDQQKQATQAQADANAAAINKQVQDGLASINASVNGSVVDLDGASAILMEDLNAVIADLGDRRVNGTGLLGAMSTNAALAGTADYQLALASQNVTAFGNVRGEDINGLLLRQAQIKAGLAAQSSLPAFQYQVPQGASHRTVYTYTLEPTR